MPDVPVNEVVVPENRLRELHDYSGLASSMSEIGLLQPITVTKANRLVAGRHRLEAARSLGWEKIPAIVVEEDELRNRLAEIDENLQRFDLTVWEQAKHAEERERVLEAMNQRATPRHNQHAPATVAGAKTTADVAKEAGMSERSWQQRVKIGRSLGPETREALDMADPEDEKHRAFLNSTTQLNTVADISNKRGDKQAAEVVKGVLGGDHKNVYEAYPQEKFAPDKAGTLRRDPPVPPNLPPKTTPPGVNAGYDSIRHFRALTKHDPKEAASAHSNKLDPNAVQDEIRRAKEAIQWLEAYIGELRAKTRLSAVK